MGTIAIGDVHGCLEELDELLGLVLPRRHRVVFVGDLIDRGPDSAGVVARVRELGVPCVMGNHDDKAVRWARHEARRRGEPAYTNPMRMSNDRVAEHARLSESDMAWLGTLPLVLDLGGGWWATHAGPEPRRPWRRQTAAALMRCRWVDGAGMMLRSLDRPDGGFHWAERWAGPESVVYGHHVHGLDAVRIDRRPGGVTCAGIDTGCCFGGHLSAYVIDTGEVIQVKARRAYAELRIPDDA